MLIHCVVTGQNGSGQNGTDKMVWTKWYRPYGQNVIRQNGMDKMVRTNWYGQNGTNKMVASFGIDYNSCEINTYLVTRCHK